ncbi:MAG: YitT family protein [Eubacterium sp.]
MKFDLKKDLKRLLVVCLASVLMALNIKSFVRTGGLYPGGATGLSLLIQRGAQMYLGLALPYTVINVILNAIPISHRFPLYREKIYPVLLSVYCTDQCTYGPDSRHCYYF